MRNETVYDFVIIGGGISSCVFVSSHIKNGFNGKIAIIENGRNLGGRCSTRHSITNKGWKLNHGSPNFNIRNFTNNELLKTFINELLDKNIIQKDTSEIIELYEDRLLDYKMSSDFYSGSNYISRSSMSSLSQNIISYINVRNQVDYFFKTLIVKLDFVKNQWILTAKNGNKYKSKFLICSSNLLLHKRCLQILSLNQIPLRKSIPFKKDKKIDLLLNLLNEQNYIQRLTFLIYTNPNYCFKDPYIKKYRYFFLSDLLEEKLKLERIIFQKQANNNLGIVIHTKNKEFINDFFQSQDKDLFKRNLVDTFNKVFDKHKYINRLINYQDISPMIWRASQPSGTGIPHYLQVCEKSKIAFCGDWFDLEGFGRVEGAIMSGLLLSQKINSLS